MASSAKPDLSAAPPQSVQNVVVYVSNDNFAQAYAVNHHPHQNVVQHNQTQPQQQQQQPHHHGYNTGGGHPLATLVKNFPPPEKSNHHHHHQHTHQVVNSPFPPVQNGGGYLPQQQQVEYHHSHSQKSFELCDTLNNRGDNNSNSSNSTNNTNYIDQNQPYVILSAASSDVAAQQNVRCDSVRSETAESSCSSLSSSGDDNANANNMVVYEPNSVSVRPGTSGGVVLTAPAPVALQQQQQQQHHHAQLQLHPHNQHGHGLSVPIMAQQHQVAAALGAVHVGRQHLTAGSPNMLVAPPPPPQQQQQQLPHFVTVPHGWKRLINNGSIVYISPNNTALSSPEQVKEYLLSNGTCKCGLECHFKYDNVFSFDPKMESMQGI